MLQGMIVFYCSSHSQLITQQRLVLLVPQLSCVPGLGGFPPRASAQMAMCVPRGIGTADVWSGGVLVCTWAREGQIRGAQP